MRPRALISSKILAYMTGLCSRADSMAYRTGVASHVQFSGSQNKRESSSVARAVLGGVQWRSVKWDRSSVAGHARLASPGEITRET